jgi:hypothetical protein
MCFSRETNCFKLDLRQARLNPMSSGASLITLQSSEVRVDVGRHLMKWKRHELAQELELTLIASNVVK